MNGTNAADARRQSRKPARSRMSTQNNNAKKNGLDSQNRGQHPKFREHLRGKLAWVSMLDPEQARALIAEFEALE